MRLRNALQTIALQNKSKVPVASWILHRQRYAIWQLHFLKIVAAEIEGKKEFPFTTGQNQYDFLDYPDFCHQVAAAVNQDEVLGIINICSGKPEKLADRWNGLLPRMGSPSN